MTTPRKSKQPSRSTKVVVDMQASESRSPDTVLREAELLALRQMADSLTSLTREMMTNREVMATIREDLAVIRERQSQHSETKEELRTMKTRLELVEQRHMRQDGAMGFASWMKDFGPWLVAVAVGTWAFLSRGLD